MYRVFVVLVLAPLIAHNYHLRCIVALPDRWYWADEKNDKTVNVEIRVTSVRYYQTPEVNND